MAIQKQEHAPRSGWTVDDRGRWVSLLDPMPLFMLARHDVIEPDVLERIVEELEPGARRSRRFSLIILPLILVVVVLGLVASVVLEGRPAWSDLVSTLMNPVLMVPIIGGAIVPWFAARRVRLARVKNVMLRHRRCPHCGYGLNGLPVSDVGATVCPECASAWALNAAGAHSIRSGTVGDVAPGSRVVLTLLLLIGTVVMFCLGVLYFVRSI